jgi:3-oxoacyl-[acyl-carrier protein] reductase
MSTKKYIKRVFKYIIKGVPNINVTANIGQNVNGAILKGKKIIITGGGRGLGYDMAKRCIMEGAEVLISGRNEKALVHVAEELGNSCKYIAFDISDIYGIEEFVKTAKTKLGGLTSIICNAGISLHEKNILDVSVENFEQQIRTNLEGNYFLAKEFIRQHDNESEADIIFISSERGYQCDDIPYGLTKVAINSLTRGLARRFYKKNIRVNAIAPGVTASDMTGRRVGGNMFAEEQVAGRFFLPEEVAETVIFLLSSASKCISGEIIACDAGQYISSYF